MKRMKVIASRSALDTKFWELHTRDYDTGVALEEIIDSLGYTDAFFPDDADPTATDEQYQEVLDKYKENGGKEGLSEEDLVSEVIRAVSRINGVSYVESFDEAGMMTKNRGFVIHDEAGNEFQFELLGFWH